ncbi:hypothetical protein ERJ75_000723900 [Trypanosoma vivax]|nr:hypothetical protein TRVL_07957 [Trypanosoma vivax]KAH8614048.1 hypothetical protein ERJ75_000723900 [Trypanosoma vivax]
MGSRAARRSTRPTSSAASIDKKSLAGRSGAPQITEGAQPPLGATGKPKIDSSGEKAASVSAPKLSKRAVQRMRVWEPVVKQPEGTSTLSSVPTTDVVWLNETTKVTLIPNTVTGGVCTRRAAASLAAVSPPTSYLVYTRDPLIKLNRVGRKNVHLVTSLTPGDDPRSALSSVPLVQSASQPGAKELWGDQGGQDDEFLAISKDYVKENGDNVSHSDVEDTSRDKGEHFDNSDEVIDIAERREYDCDVNVAESVEEADDESDQQVDELMNVETREDPSDEEMEEENEDDDEEVSEGEAVSGELKEEEPEADNKENTCSDNKTRVRSRRSRHRGLASWLARRRCRSVRRKRRRRVVEVADGEQDGRPQCRVGVLSAAQAMLPPPYRRCRRLKRKLSVTNDAQIFLVHSELRDTVPQLFPTAPFSTEEDILRSTIDWNDSPALLYARLLWDTAPHEFLNRARRRCEKGAIDECPYDSGSTALVECTET